MTRTAPTTQDESDRPGAAASGAAGVVGTFAAVCPRCDFELRGVVAAWIDSCPLDGCCGECGLSFRWATVLGPDQKPRWFVECKRSKFFPGMRTLARSMLPWRFWQQIRMTMPVSKRLWSYPLRLAILLLVLSIGLSGARTALLLPSGAPPDRVADAVGIAATVLLPWSTECPDVLMERLIPGWSSPGRPAPWAGATQGRILNSRQSIVGRTANGSLILNRTGVGPPALSWRAAQRSLAKNGFATLTACSMATIAFVALPIVRRRAKVRWAHVFRGGVFGLGLVVVIALVGCLADLWALAASGGQGWAFGGAIGLRAVPWELRFVPPLLFIWWWMVSRRYLRLDRPIAVAASVAVIGSLAGLVLESLMYPLQAMALITGW